MRSDTPRLPIVLAALVGGLALFVAGFLIAAEMRSATASPAAAVTGSGCYTNWNGNTCASGYTAVETGEWTGALFWTEHPSREEAMAGGSVICADKVEGAAGLSFGFIADMANLWSVENEVHSVNHEPCATCCAITTTAVGGTAELPPIAGIAGSPTYNYAVAAVLAFVAVVAFAAGGWYARRRWWRG